ncbi:phospholipase/carboxylesterase [Alphaproteobacteria bacterium]|nr:phospholipase/carboxylesterase [Alphaproteobacteria bacterium]
MEEIVIEATKRVKKIMFVFHDYGSEPNDILTVGELFSSKFKDVEIHVPKALEECENEEGGYQWFSIAGDTAEEKVMALRNCEEAIKSYIDEILAAKGLVYKNVILAGFFQGAMLAIDLGLKLGVNSIISFAGILLDQETRPSSPNTRLLMVHARQDDIIPLNVMLSSINVLRQNGLGVCMAISEEAEHAKINAEMVSAAIQFLKV